MLDRKNKNMKKERGNSTTHVMCQPLGFQKRFSMSLVGILSFCGLLELLVQWWLFKVSSESALGATESPGIQGKSIQRWCQIQCMVFSHNTTKIPLSYIYYKIKCRHIFLHFKHANAATGKVSTRIHKTAMMFPAQKNACGATLRSFDQKKSYLRVPEHGV